MTFIRKVLTKVSSSWCLFNITIKKKKVHIFLFAIIYVWIEFFAITKITFCISSVRLVARHELWFEDTYLTSCLSLLLARGMLSSFFKPVNQTDFYCTHAHRFSSCAAEEQECDLVVSSQICVCSASQLAQSLKVLYRPRIHTHAAYVLQSWLNHTGNI